MIAVAATIIEERITQVDEKIVARRSNPNFDRNVEALEAVKSELQRILALAEETDNV